MWNRHIFFEEAKNKGIETSQVQIFKSKTTSYSLFHGEIDNCTIASSQSVLASGIVDGKLGSASTERLDKESNSFLIDGILETAKNNEKKNEVGLFKGSEKYCRKRVFSSSLSSIKNEDKIDILKKIEQAILSYDSRISEVESVVYEDEESSSEFYNSYGLALKEKSNVFVVQASAIAKESNETKTSGEIFFGSNFQEFDYLKFAQKVAKNAIDKLGGTSCSSGYYPTVLKHDCFASLLRYFLRSTSAEEIQKNSSQLIGKLNEKVASSIITISERPLDKTCFYSYFDDEGVAKFNKDIVKKGRLLTYLYNRETAAKDNAKTTANAVWSGGKMGIGVSYVTVKPSRKGFNEMIKPIENGVYITDLAGLGTGMNAESGNFSCQAEGFLIKNGKIDRPLSLITLSGNLFQMFKDIKDIDNEHSILANEVSCPNVYVKKMSIGGE